MYVCMHVGGEGGGSSVQRTFLSVQLLRWIKTNVEDDNSYNHKNSHSFWVAKKECQFRFLRCDKQDKLKWSAEVSHT